MSNFRSADPPRPSSSSSKATQKTAGAPSINDVFDLSNRGHKKSGSFSSRRLSEASARRSEDVAGDAANMNRWSSSTASSTGLANHRKTGSFSKRFSFGGPSLNPGFRSMSPSKRPRPSGPHAEPGFSQSSNPPPGSLPEVDRFSPLTLPGTAAGADQPSRPSRADRSPSSSAVQHPAAAHRDLANGAESPQRRQRDPLLKAGSHLSDIMESERGVPTSAYRATGAAVNGRPESRRAASRGAVSRETSPSKRSPGDSDQNGNAPVRRRSKKDKDKKMMLSKALKRANEAVHLDNEQSYQQAVWAYEEACGLLDSVLARTSTDTERQKLTSIRGTYSTRIDELKQIQSQNARANIGHAVSDSQSTGPSIRDSLDHALDEDLEPVIETATMTTVAGSDAAYAGLQDPHAIGEAIASPSLLYGTATRYANAPVRNNFLDEASPHAVLTPPLSRPAPLSPRLRTAEQHAETATMATATAKVSHQRESGVVGAHSGRPMRDTGSWFVGGGDDQGSNPNSSHHSVDSYDGVRRRDIRTQPNDTEADFDAALEAAIESAYDGYEPYGGGDFGHGLAIQEPSIPQTGDPIADQARSYALRQAKIQRLSQRSRSQIDPDLTMDFSDGGSGIDSDEEDRLLDTVRDEAPPPAQQLQPGVPRQSDSSGYSNQTLASSTASSVNTGATSLGTVDEHVLLPAVAEVSRTNHTALSPPKIPPIPRTADSSPSRDIRRDVLGASQRGESPLRDRRFSGHSKAKNLRIETQASGRRTSDTSEAPQSQPQTHAQSQAQAPTQVKGQPQPPDPSRLAPAQDQPPTRGAPRLEPSAPPCPYPSPSIGGLQSGGRTPTTPTFAKPVSAGSSDPSPTAGTSNRPSTKGDRPILKHNASSLSLSKQSYLGVRTPDDTEPSPDTPMSFAFSGSNILTPPERQDSRLGFALSTPMEASFGSMQPMNSAKMKIFDHEIHSATLPGSPNPDIQNGPKALEPCPDSLLLRPFWLLRCVQQTLIHPKGGYVTTRLFVPHDVWKVKSTKIKGVEDKIANLDLLTAALLKLSAVDTEDADAVLEEMQALETVLDQAQSNLSKRLGSEVGVQGVSALFKDAPSATSPTTGDPNATQMGNEGNTTSTGSKTGSKGYLNSWRKLRNKSSSTNLSSGYSNREGVKDYVTTMASVPMTSNNEVKIRHRTKLAQAVAPKLDPALLDGPHANYAGALARLCDAVQVLDQIARQAEDPGLKFTTQTHVGLELSARHAAEFFGFYVCRFVLQDLSMLTEKFVKRATEWVMS